MHRLDSVFRRKGVKMKKLCFVLMLLISFQLFADDDEKLKLVVMEFEDLSGSIEQSVLAGASEYLRVGFASTNRYVLITKERQKAQIGDLRKKYNTDPTYKACTDKNCQIQLGQALSADMIVKTTISLFAGLYTISSELIDLEKEATIIAAKEDYDGSPKSLRQAIDKIVVQIVEAEKKENELTEDVSERAAKKSKQQNTQVNSKDQIACEYARKKDSSLTWKTYLSKYPEGECAAEAKENLDKKACAAARKRSSIEDWKQYLKEFPDGKCEFEASEKISALEEKSMSADSEREESLAFYSAADKKLEDLFSGRWNFGLGIGYNKYPNFEIGFTTGLDFNWKLFGKPYGGGAGNLWLGFGFDFKYWMLPDSDLEIDELDHLINVPLQLNFGYEFKINKENIRYLGLWLSLGMSIDTWIDDKLSDNDKTLQLSFAWDITMNIIFKNGMLFIAGFGGNKSKGDAKAGDRSYWEHDHGFDVTIGTGVIF